MLNKTLQVLVTLIGAVLAGCATTYQPLQVDSTSGQYRTSIKVDPGGVQTFVTTTDPLTYPVILLTAESNYSPSKFEFMVRSVLAQAGMTAVYNTEEFKNYAADRHFDAAAPSVNAEMVQKFSKQIAPVLLVNSKYTTGENAWVRVELQIQDAGTGQVLLRVDHNRLVWLSFDSEALYPVLNRLREWVKASAKGTNNAKGST